MLPHEADESSGEEDEEIVPPDNAIVQAKTLQASADGLSTAIQEIERSQQVHVAALAALADAVDKQPARARVEPLIKVLERLGSAAEASLDSTARARAGVLGGFQAERLSAMGNQAAAYREALAAHEAALLKLKGVPGKANNKSKQAALQQSERDAHSKLSALAKAVKRSELTADDDFAAVCRGTLREVAFSQLQLHARALEAYTSALDVLGPPSPPRSASGGGSSPSVVGEA